MQELKLIEGAGKSHRIPSTIQFPYTDMTDAIAVVEGLLKGGGLALTRDQLAVAMGLAPNGGGFATKVATAKTFGVVESQAGKYQLTDLGHELADPNRRAEAAVDAFMAVELYRRVYDEFRGKRLPPRPHGLEAAFVSFGVSPKNAKIARLAFDKSARMAGFFPNGDEDRLVVPFQSAKATEILTADGSGDDNGPSILQAKAALSSSAPDAVPGLHPSITGWLKELPEPGGEWGKEAQADWLQALATMFRTIYKNDDKRSIQVTYPPARAE